LAALTCQKELDLQLQVLNSAALANKADGQLIALGTDAKTRLDKDVTLTMLFASLQHQAILARLVGKCADIRDALPTLGEDELAPEEAVRYVDFSSCVKLMHPDVLDIIKLHYSRLQLQADGMKKIIHTECKGNHMPDTSWKLGLNDPQDLKEVTTAASATIQTLKGFAIHRANEGADEATWVSSNVFVTVLCVLVMCCVACYFSLRSHFD
jgi:hypothetical protein